MLTSSLATAIVYPMKTDIQKLYELLEAVDVAKLGQTDPQMREEILVLRGKIVAKIKEFEDVGRVPVPDNQ